jgi:hypothetical protein
MTEINIIKLEGKPLEKLIDVISKGIGRIYNPRAIRNEAESEAHKIAVIERAKNNALAEGREIQAESIDRVQERLLYKELKRQINLERIIQTTAEQLINKKEVSNEPVDEDWIIRFFNIVQDVSNEEMQKIWSRILAGEITQPRTYSLRTLELLKNLDKNEAEIFMKFGRLAISSEDYSFLINPNHDKLLEEKYNLTFRERLLLEELGLINALDLALKIKGAIDELKGEIFKIGKTSIEVNLEQNIPEMDISVLVFTKIGCELLGLIDTTPDLDYIQLFASKFRRKGVNVRYAQMLSSNNGGVVYSEFKEVPLSEEEIKREQERVEKENKISENSATPN